VGAAPGGAGDPWRTIVTLPAPRRSLQRRLATLALSARADLAERLWSPVFARRLQELLARGRYDIVQGEGLELARYLLLLDRAPGAGPLLVFDDHNAEYVLQRRAAATDLRQPRRWPRAAYSLAQWGRLRRFERQLLRACDLTVCVSEADARALQALAPERPLVVAPNGVDTEYYAPPRAPAARAGAAPPRFDLAFSGAFDYRPNVDAALWFVEEVWPLLRARQLRLALIGRNPVPEVTRLVGREGVVVTGSVADDRPYFAGARVYIVPMRYGGGARLKLLNALAMGCAVVATGAGCEGVAVRDGEHLLIADGAAAFAAAIARLLDDPNLCARLGAAGRGFVQREYDWAGIAARLEAGYEAAFRIRESPPASPRPSEER
jgi:glycosyltransferase involved in cell wall biosynthesis